MPLSGLVRESTVTGQGEAIRRSRICPLGGFSLDFSRDQQAGGDLV
jgi:hypothetical protein